MADAGVKRAIAFVTSAFSSYSGCRQYRENIAAARAAVGDRAPQVDKIRVFFNHPGFVRADGGQRRGTRSSIFPADVRPTVPVLFTAHSIPMSMADDVPIRAAASRSRAGWSRRRRGHADWRLVYQSRSGPPTQPWLEPDICDAIRELHAAGGRRVVIAPIGFISDHMEVLYDLDTEAADLCRGTGCRTWPVRRRSALLRRSSRWSAT